MERIAVFAATEREIAGCRQIEGLDFHVTGIGAANTAAAVARILGRSAPDYYCAIQAGIAGAYHRGLNIGDAVLVVSDRQADLGAWRGDRLEEFARDAPPIECPRISDIAWQGPVVRAQSVNTAATPLVPRGLADIETMEGAAFFTAAAESGVKFLQLRVISNYVDDPREKWQIERAIAALPDALAQLLEAVRTQGSLSV